MSLWMCENGTGHGTRGSTRTDSSVTLLHAVQTFSQRERDVEECRRRVGRVGPEHRSSRRGRGEQRRPLRRRVGTVGACPPPLRGRSAICRPNAAYPSGGPKIDSHVDFDSTAAWRHHVSMPPSSRSQSAATTALTARDRNPMRAFHRPLGRGIGNWPYRVPLHINAQLRTQDAQAQTVEKGERQQRQSEVSAGSQEGECDDGL